eukprot:763193-Hanusia_phi.AAC.7
MRERGKLEKTGIGKVRSRQEHGGTLPSCPLRGAVALSSFVELEDKAAQGGLWMSAASLLKLISGRDYKMPKLGTIQAILFGKRKREEAKKRSGEMRSNLHTARKITFCQSLDDLFCRPPAGLRH